MKKVSLILAVLLFALTVPAWAVVTITCQQVGDTNEVLVHYAVTDEPNKVRAFALDVNVSPGVITGVDDSISNWYTIYPGTIVIVNGEVNDPGTAVADPCDHPDTKGGIGTDGITVEMGALYSPPEDNSPNAPNDTDYLFSFFVSQDCKVHIEENGTRGGVVLTDPNADPTVVASDCNVVRECFPQCRADEYDQWKSASANMPPCWCYPRQCHGDSDDYKEYIKGKGYYYTHFKDLDLLMAAWNVREPPQGPGMPWPNPLICADFNRGPPEYIKGKGYYRVHFKDLDVLMAYWNVREAPQGPGINPDCLDCP